MMRALAFALLGLAACGLRSPVTPTAAAGPAATTSSSPTTEAPVASAETPTPPPTPAPPPPPARVPREPCSSEVASSFSRDVIRVTNHFDGAGRKIAFELVDGKKKYATKLTYDQAGRLIKLDEGDRVVVYRRDAAGRAIERTVTRKGEPPFLTTYTRDAAGRLTVKVNGFGETRYAYDEAGHKVREEVFDPGGTRPTVTATWEYDRAGRQVVKTTDAGWSFERVEWAYDGAGREVTRQRWRGTELTSTTHVTYDRAGRKVGEEERAPDGTVVARRAWTYTPAGDLASDEDVTVGGRESWTRSRYVHCDEAGPVIEPEGG